jgi:hypothetical protein
MKHIFFAAALTVSLFLFNSTYAFAEAKGKNMEVNTMTSIVHAGKNGITFTSQGYNLAAHLYAPKNFDASNTYPTVIFSGPFNQVKEQTGAVYGAKLAKIGYVVLVFDHLATAIAKVQSETMKKPPGRWKTSEMASAFWGRFRLWTETNSLAWVCVPVAGICQLSQRLINDSKPSPRSAA